MHRSSPTIGDSRMNVLVDRGLCIGCDLCAKMCPKTFRMQNRKAEVVDSYGHSKDELDKTAGKCPTGAVVVSKTNWAENANVRL